MKWLSHFLFFLLVISTATASEIIGWKTPITNLAYEGLETPGIVRLEKPPEKSPFFGAGDELWDVRSVLPKAASSAQWAVWNATTGRIVVKGSWGTIREMEGAIVTPTLCRITVDAFRIDADGSLPDFTKAPDSSISVVARSGQKTSVIEADEKSAIRLVAEPSSSPETSLIDLMLDISTSLPDTPDLTITTSVSLLGSKSVWVARSFDGVSGTDIRVSGVIELLDGTPYEEFMLRQEGDAAVPFRVDRSPGKRIAIEGGGWLLSSWLDFELARYLFTGKRDVSDDPFAPDAGNEDQVLFDELPTAQVPTVLEPYFGGEVLDVREPLRKIGVTFGDGDFAGYDPRIARVFLFSKSEHVFDMFEQLFSGMSSSGMPTTIAFSSRGKGEMRLLARSGQKASMKSSRAKAEQTRDLTIEPTIGEGGALVDLRILYEEKTGEKLTKALNTAVTLQNGEFLRLLKSKLPDGSETELEIKAEILEHR